MLERTLAIIKPDAVTAKNTGKIIDRIEADGFIIRGMKKIHLTKAMAEGFYAVHKEKPFYDSLTSFMASGPCVVMCLEKENAIKAWRELMGATNPSEAKENTLRKLYGTKTSNNAVHGSDAPETAKTETAFFFSEAELV